MSCPGTTLTVYKDFWIEYAKQDHSSHHVNTLHLHETSLHQIMDTWRLSLRVRTLHALNQDYTVSGWNLIGSVDTQDTKIRGSTYGECLQDCWLSFPLVRENSHIHQHVKAHLGPLLLVTAHVIYVMQPPTDDVGHFLQKNAHKLPKSTEMAV